MGRALLSSMSPASSEDGSDRESVGGGAPLWSPGKRPSRVQREVDSSPETISPTTSLTGDSTNHPLAAEPDFLAEEAPRTPSDQEIQTPEPFKPQRTFSKSTLRAAARALLNSTVTSIGVAPPALTLSAYPGPGAVLRHQPSLPIIIPTSVPVAIPAPQVQGLSAISGSTTHNFINSMQSMNLNSKEEDLHPTQKIHREEIRKIQARIWGLRQGMQRQSAIPKEFLKSFDYDVHELMNNTATMNQVVDDLAAQYKKVLNVLERVSGLEATIRALEGDVSDYKERAQNAEKAVSSLASRSDEDMRTIQFLKEQLRQNEMARTLLQEQVNGKRNLWLNIHTDPQERAAALESLARSSTPLSGHTFTMPIDPGYTQSARGPGSVHSNSSYTTSVKSGPGSEYLASPAPGSVYASSLYGSGAYSPHPQFIPHSHSGPAAYAGPPQYRARRMSTATATSTTTSSVGYAASRNSGGGSSRPSSTGPRRPPRVSTISETGSPKERKRKTAPSLVRPDLNEPAYLPWIEDFQALFALIYGFCAAYFHELPSISTDWKSHIQAQTEGDLWEYICLIGQFSHEPEPGDHALRLLMDRDSRPYFMQRLLLQHIMLYMFSWMGWKEFSEDIDDEMRQIENCLKSVDPSKTTERQVLIDRRAELIKEMTESENAASFKNFKLTQHHQFLKTMVAPFLPKRTSGNITNEAFFDLFTITASAWELAIRLFQSRLTFQYIWNDAGTRFSINSHEPLDCRVSRLTLQYEHCRVMLAATPAVTVRNDQGKHINSKNILKSGVLVLG